MAHRARGPANRKCIGERCSTRAWGGKEPSSRASVEMRGRICRYGEPVAPRAGTGNGRSGPALYLLSHDPCEHTFVTSQGSAYPRFRRALDSGNATIAHRGRRRTLRPSQPRHSLPSLPPRATGTHPSRLRRCQRLGPRSCSAWTAASSFSRTSAGRLSHLSSMAPPSEPAVSTSRLPIPSRRPKRVCLSVRS